MNLSYSGNNKPSEVRHVIDLSLSPFNVGQSTALGKIFKHHTYSSPLDLATLFPRSLFFPPQGKLETRPQSVNRSFSELTYWPVLLSMGFPVAKQSWNHVTMVWLRKKTIKVFLNGQRLPFAANCTAVEGSLKVLWWRSFRSGCSTVVECSAHLYETTWFFFSYF